MNRNNIYADALEQEMNSLELNFGRHDIADGTAFIDIGLPGKKISHHKMIMVIRENGQVTIQSFAARDVKPSQRMAMLECVNKLNCEQKYIKFSLTRDNDVNAELEIIVPKDLEPEQAAEYLFMMLLAMSQWLDKEIPTIYAVCWAENEEDEEEDEDEQVDTGLLEVLFRSKQKLEDDEDDE